MAEVAGLPESKRNSGEFRYKPADVGELARLPEGERNSGEFRYKPADIAEVAGLPESERNSGEFPYEQNAAASLSRSPMGFTAAGYEWMHEIPKRAIEPGGLQRRRRISITFRK